MTDLLNISLRKGFVLFFSVLWFAISGCSDSSRNKIDQEQKSGSGVKKVKVNFLSGWSNRKSKRDLVESSVREFEFQNQDVDVDLKFVLDIWPNTDLVYEYLVKTVQTHKIEWDILNIDKNFYNRISDSIKDSYWAKKYLVNFEEFDWFRQSHKDAIIKDSKFRQSWGGILPGPLIEGYYHALWYNKKVAEKIGLQIKPFGLTFDDLLGYVSKACEYNKTASQKVILLSDVVPSKIKSDLLNSLIISALGEIDTSKVDQEHNLAALKRALFAIEKLARYHPLDLVANVDPKIDPILEEKVLFGLYPSTTFNIFETTDKEKVKNLVPVELPVLVKPGIFYIGSYQSIFSVLKDAPHRDEAIRMIRFMCSNDFAERWISNTKNPTALKLRIDASGFGQDEFDKFNTEIIRKYEGKLTIFDFSKILFGPRSKISIDGLPVLSGKI